MSKPKHTEAICIRTHGPERVNEAIAMPDPLELYFPDGRVLRLTRWRTETCINAFVRVEIEGYVEVPVDGRERDGNGET